MLTHYKIRKCVRKLCRAKKVKFKYFDIATTDRSVHIGHDVVRFDPLFTFMQRLADAIDNLPEQKRVPSTVLYLLNNALEKE